MNALEIIRDHGPLLVLVALFAVTALSIMRGRRRKASRRSTPSEIVPTTRSDTPVSTPETTPQAHQGLERDQSAPSGEAQAKESSSGATGAGLAAAAGGALLMGVAASQMAGGGDPAPSDASNDADGSDADDGDAGDGGDGGGDGGDGGGDGGGD